MLTLRHSQTNWLNLVWCWTVSIKQKNSYSVILYVFLCFSSNSSCVIRKSKSNVYFKKVSTRRNILFNKATWVYISQFSANIHVQFCLDSDRHVLSMGCWWWKIQYVVTNYVSFYTEKARQDTEFVYICVLHIAFEALLHLLGDIALYHFYKRSLFCLASKKLFLLVSEWIKKADSYITQLLNVS